MKHTWVKRIGALALAGSLAAMAEQGDSNAWTLRLGASYREFQDVKFSPVEYANWGNWNSATGPAGVQNATPQAIAAGSLLPFTPATLNYVRWNGGDKGVAGGGGWAPVVGAGKDLMEKGPFRLGFVSNLQYYALDTARTEDGTMAQPGDAFSAVQYLQTAVDLAKVVPALPPPLPAPFFTPGVLVAGAAADRFWIRNRFSADVWVLDAGIEAKASCAKCLNLVLAGGPTLSLANTETLQEYDASWVRPAGNPTPSNSYHVKLNRTDIDAAGGLYGAVGLNVALNEKWSLAALYRYDYVAKEVGTDQAELNLKGSSGQLMLMYAF
jgi:hypothetical protein